MKKLWFRAKRFGYGWYPGSWEGFLVLALYLCVVMLLVWHGRELSAGISVLTQIIFPSLSATAALLLCCYLTGETAYWNWSWRDTGSARTPNPANRLKYKWWVIAVCVALMIIFSVLSVVGAPLGRVLYAEPSIEAARQCTQDSECVSLGDRCGFGCAVTVNSDSQEQVDATLDFFDEGACSMLCPVVEPQCVAGMCTSQ